MIHTEKFSSNEISNIIIALLCVWLLFSSHANATVQSYSDEDKYKYPYLADILDVYCDFYLSGPNNIEDLVKFAESYYAKFPDEFCYYSTLNRITIPKLKEHKNQIRIVQNHCEYALLLDNVSLYSYSDFPCCDLVELYYLEDQPSIIRSRIAESFYFFRKQIPILYRTRLISPLVKEIKGVYKENNVNKEKIVFLRYLEEGHLFNYCTSNVDLYSSYYKKIENILQKFCKEHNIDEIYLYVYCESSE